MKGSPPLSNNNNNNSSSQQTTVRIYWQHWIKKLNDNQESLSRRELVTSSISVRVSKLALVTDITRVLRQKLQINETNDCLVLVGTLYSLPKNHFYFSLPQQQQDGATTQQTVKNDPVHFVCTLPNTMTPLSAMQRLETKLTAYLDKNYVETDSFISPKLQLFYVPSPDCTFEDKTIIPNCIELDGYCTSGEEEDEEEEADGEEVKVDNDEEENAPSIPTMNGERDEQRRLMDRLPFLKQAANLREPTSRERLRHHYNTLQEELRSLTHIHSGYMLKSDEKDKNVWRRYHCVLTSESLWYTSRVYNDKHSECAKIDLCQSLLVQPTPEYAPLFKTPYAFELIDESGVSHVFRTSHKAQLDQWIASISTQIVSSYEISLVKNAELLILEQCRAKNQALYRVAVAPLWELCQQYKCPVQSPAVQIVLRWGMLVAQYQCSCRHNDPKLWERAKACLLRARHISQSVLQSSSAVETHVKFVEKILQQQINAADGPPIDLFDGLLKDLQGLAVAAS